MNQTLERIENDQAAQTLAAARAGVRAMLLRSPAFHALPKAQRDQLAHDMVKVAAFIAGGEDGTNTPAAAEFSTSGANLPQGIPQPRQAAGQDITGAPARQGAQAMANLVNEINFPKFVAGLIDGVFNAIVDASIKQMEAYAELVKNVAKSVDQFMKDNVSENQARDYLAGRYPDHLEVDISGEQPALKPRDGHDEENLPDFFADLGLSSPVESLDEETVEQQLVPAARKRMAMDRQQLLATMVLMGINRLVVTNGQIQASVMFKLDTSERMRRDFTQTTDQSGYKHTRTRPGFWGWFSPSNTREDEFGRFKVSTVQEEDSEASIRMKAELSGKVNVNFKSETFPLEKMADVLQINEIQQKSPAAQTAPGTSPNGTPAPAPVQ